VTPKVDAELQQFTKFERLLTASPFVEFSDLVTAPLFIAQVWIRMIILSIPKIISGIQEGVC